MVYTLAYRMLGSRAAAEDVVQDSFVEVIRKAREFRGDGNIRAWIKRIAINKCLSHLRSPWIARQSEPRNDEIAELARSDDDSAQQLGRRQELLRALGLLSAVSRSVVWLHAVEGYTHQEIGQLMGRSTSFSKTQLSRAYAQLRSELHPEENDDEAEPCLGILKTV